MAVTYDNTVKASRMTATRDSVADGTLEIRDSGNVVLATFGLSASGGTIASGVWTLTFDATTVSAGAAGTANNAVIKNSTGTVRISGLTVGTSGTDITIDNTSIANGQQVQITGTPTITHAA